MKSTQSDGGVWSAARRPLTAGLVLTVTLVAAESLSVATVLPIVSRQLGGIRLYGWVFSAFFLGSLVGIVVAGREADRSGLYRPVAAGLVLFGAGLAVGGAAPTMGVLVAGRAVQGLGAGAIPACAYVAIGRGYPSALRPRMFAVLSTAWVVPGLVGPALSGLVADHVGWRWVFLGLLPLVVLAGALTLPQVGRLGPAAASDSDADVAPPVAAPGGLLVDALRVAAGAGLALGGLTIASPLPTGGLILAGLVIGVPAFVRLVPAGTLRARPGLPVAILIRGLLTFMFFGGDAYVPLTITSVRGASATAAGVALTVCTLLWTTGSWIQEHWIHRIGPRRLIVLGFGSILLGIAGFATLLWHSVPLAVGPAMWGVAGLGMGLGYSPISVTVLHEAPPGQEGSASASLQLTDVLGVALGTGVGGAAVALGHASGWDPRVGLLVAFVVAATVGLAGLALTRRLPVELA